MANSLIPGDVFEYPQFNDRNSAFQKTIGFDVFKANPEKFAIELRKSHRSEHTAKRRALLGPSKCPAIFSQAVKGNISITELPLALIKSYPNLANEEISSLEKLSIIRKILENESATDILRESLNTLMELLAYSEDMPLDLIVRMGFISIFIKYLDWNFGSLIVYPAIACLANVSACNHYFITCLVNAGGLDGLVNAINPRALSVSSLAIKALANVTIDSKEFLPLTKNPKVLGKINTLLEEAKEVNTELYMSLGFYVHSITNFSEEITLAEANMLLAWLERIVQLDENCIKKDAILAIYSISCMNFACIKSKAILQFLVDQMDQALPVKTISNIIYNSNEEAGYFFRIGIIEKLVNNGKSPLTSMRKSCYKCLNNSILANPSLEILQISPFLIAGLKDKDECVRKECAFLFSNLAKNFLFSTWQELISLGLLEELKKNLESENDSQLINELLYACTFMFFTGKLESEMRNDVTNRLVDLFEEHDCVESLEELCSHSNPEISEFATEVISEYFAGYINGAVSSFSVATEFNFS